MIWRMAQECEKSPIALRAWTEGVPISCSRDSARCRQRLKGQDAGVEVLSSRILLRPADLGLSRRFYRDVLGLAVYREFGPPADPSMVFFLGGGLLEISGSAGRARDQSVMVWLQVRDVHAEHERLGAAGARILRAPEVEPWGLTEMWIEDPDGLRIVLVEIPADHPLRRDQRPAQSDEQR
jgi:predicted enzyme related to lactoylglutathione lyase